MTTYTWTDNTMRGGSSCDVDKVADNLMHLKYNTADIQIATCTTASGMAEKTVALADFTLKIGATVIVTFTNANTATTPTLNVNSTGAKPIVAEDGAGVSANNPAYFPAASMVEFLYDGTYWRFKKRVITSYVNGTSWYRIWTDGFTEQGGIAATPDHSVSYVTVSLLKAFSNTNYSTLSALLNNTNQLATIHTYGKTTTSFSMMTWHYSTAQTDSVVWEAKGY